MRTGFSRAAYDVLVRGQLKVSPEVKSEILRVKKLKIDWKTRVRAGQDAWINVSAQIFNELDAFQSRANLQRHLTRTSKYNNLSEQILTV